MWWTCTFPHSALICNAVLCLILSNVRRARRRTGEQIHSYRISTLTATGAQVVQTKTQTHYFKWINLTFNSEPIFDDIRERERRLHSFGLGVYFDFVSIFAKTFERLLTFHVWSRQYRQWHPSYFIPHLSNWNLSRNWTNFSWYFSCGISGIWLSVCWTMFNEHIYLSIAMHCHHPKNIFAIMIVCGLLC